jgi:hypothetical protein
MTHWSDKQTEQFITEVEAAKTERERRLLSEYLANRAKVEPNNERLHERLVEIRADADRQRREQRDALIAEHNGRQTPRLVKVKMTSVERPPQVVSAKVTSVQKPPRDVLVKIIPTPDR